VKDVDVGGEGERDDVGFEAVDDGPGLLSGAAVGLVNFERLIVRGAPVVGESGVEFVVEGAGGVVGDVEEGGLLCGGAIGRAGRERGGYGRQDEDGRCKLESGNRHAWWFEG